MLRGIVLALCLVGCAWGGTIFKTPTGKPLIPGTAMSAFPLIELKAVKVYQCKAQGDADPWMLIQLTVVHHLHRADPLDIYATVRFTWGSGHMGDESYTLWAERPPGEKPFTMTLAIRSFVRADRVHSEKLPVVVTFDQKPWVPPEKRPKFGE